MEIRFLKSDERKQAFQLIVQSIENNQLSYLKDQQENMCFLGAFDRELIAVACVQDFNYLHWLYVLPQYRHQNVGTSLLNVIKRCVVDSLQVNVTLENRLFFLKNGFHEKKSGDVYILLEYQREVSKHFFCYEDVYDFISQQKSRVYELNHFKKLMKYMGCPQNLLKSIHICGTNGKGSTTNYVRSVLENHGYKVATFTTPVLTTRLEVMRVNQVPINENRFLEYANKYMSLWLEYELSVFEIEVFIAIMYFIECHVDFAIFEVGLGGELDATNIIQPIVCANTNIGMDHTEYLGNTYADIAKAKAGIIKDGIAFITGEKKQECIEVFQMIAKQHQSPLLFVKAIENKKQQQGKVSFDYCQEHVVLDIPAIYQCENCALAMEILYFLHEKKYIQLNRKIMLNSLKTTIWQGRFEIMHYDPLIIIDGAHNAQGMDAFCKSARAYQNIKVIFSALKDKDTHSMIRDLLQITNDITVCEFNFYRAQTAKKLAENFPVKIEKNWRYAIDEAYHHKGTVFITGSLYFISQVRAYLVEKNKTCVE